MRYDLATSDVLKCWVHEAFRVFRDLLVGNDRDKFDGLLWHVLRIDWSYTRDDRANEEYFITFNPVATPLPKEQAKQFGHGLYGTKYADVKELAETGLKKYAREQRELDLYLVDEQMQYLSAMDRVLSAPGGSLLVAGRSGAGRRSLVLLVAFLHHMEVVTLQVRAPCHSAAKGTEHAALILPLHCRIGKDTEHAALILPLYCQYCRVVKDTEHAALILPLHCRISNNTELASVTLPLQCYVV